MMTDDEIRDAIARYLHVEFANFGGDELLEGPLNCDERAYDRACELLEGARIKIEWRKS
jgi:hypothetical protein